MATKKAMVTEIHRTIPPKIQTRKEMYIAGTMKIISEAPAIMI